MLSRYLTRTQTHNWTRCPCGGWIHITLVKYKDIRRGYISFKTMLVER